MSFLVVVRCVRGLASAAHKDCTLIGRLRRPQATLGVNAQCIDSADAREDVFGANMLNIHIDK